MLSANISCAAQASDVDIVKALLGQPYGQANAILAKMKVWFQYHYRDTKNVDGEDNKAKFYSIENDMKRTKVWTIYYNKEQIIDEIIINYRHDDRSQVEDCQAMRAYTSEGHTGRYSTDLVFKLKK